MHDGRRAEGPSVLQANLPSIFFTATSSTDSSSSPAGSCACRVAMQGMAGDCAAWHGPVCRIKWLIPWVSSKRRAVAQSCQQPGVPLPQLH